MASKQEVEKYLKELNVKMKIFGILFFDDRSKNQQALHDLEISPNKRKEIISTLKAEDYSEGPLDEKMHGILPMWVFGKKFNKKDIYIKISMGLENNSAVCISFHIAEKPMRNPFKK
ncbi:MAG: type II toxin-antitoxin system MqsR family toxin [Bacteroidales bacterium]|nr:type II toxin-antitoxin system MqsR family toxin [Bacteroidales bacterium]